MGRHIGKCIGAAALTALAGLATTTPASADTLSCGQTITTSTVLSNDVGPCTSFGIIIGADNITFDLNGHRIFATTATADKAGVFLLNRTGVTVRNGTVNLFDVGVAIDGGSANTVTNITARDNIGGGAGSIGGDGIAIMSSRLNQIVNNDTSNNGPYSGIGLYSRRDSDHPGTPGVARDNVISKNNVTGNIISRDRVSPSGTDNDGIRVENDAAFNTFVENKVSGNGLDGISLFADTFDNVVRGNQVDSNGFYRTTARRGSGIIVFSRAARNVVEGNFVTRNADSGIDIRPPVGTSVGALSNRIANNTAVGNSALPFIPSANFGQSWDLKDGNVTCDANVWSGNRYHTFNQDCVPTGGQQV